MDLQLAHDIISICNEDSGGATVEDCAEQLGITGARLADVFDTFEELVRSEKLMRIAGDRYISAKQPQEITGIYKGYTPTFGFVLSQDLTEDVYIAEQNRHTAMNNDKVTVRILHSGDGRHKQEGEIVSIVERANKTLVGTFQLEKHSAFVTPDDERIREDIYVPLDKTGGAVAVPVSWSRSPKWPEEGRQSRRGSDGSRVPEIPRQQIGHTQGTCGILSVGAYRPEGACQRCGSSERFKQEQGETQERGAY